MVSKSVRPCVPDEGVTSTVPSVEDVPVPMRGVNFTVEGVPVIPRGVNVTVEGVTVLLLGGVTISVPPEDGLDGVTPPVPKEIRLGVVSLPTPCTL